MRPYKEIEIEKNIFIREFLKESNSEEMKWHRDYEDRIIESVNDTDWMIQLDNELPKIISGEVFIPVGVYHRLIKGNGDLKIILKKL